MITFDDSIPFQYGTKTSSIALNRTLNQIKSTAAFHIFLNQNISRDRRDNPDLPVEKKLVTQTGWF